ncbi:NlpC/P60 family protein [Roseovarius aestuariivivens]|uniref:C40 family peptidase n=1 Tax=Roseovarius aestuariivivens TaxID=1888910 RepID=UPI0010808672|nr:NlpC/P60 family protein [Roseovarius aestuariivivens]
MTDPRRLHANGRVAHASLIGRVDAALFVEGEDRQVVVPVTTLWNKPAGRRERELLLGDGFCLLEERDGHVFGYALRDNHAGYIESAHLAAPARPVTHVVHARLTHALPAPDFKTQGAHLPLSLGSRVTVTGKTGKWAEVLIAGDTLYLPACHLRPEDTSETDPVAVAERLIGTPYVWGGNSAMGIDCSGLVTAACLACGVPCPGDSDLQEEELGHALPMDAPLQRGDLLFWKGHVAWVADPDTLIHANAYHMAVAYEPLQNAIARIKAQGDGLVTARKRLEFRQ